MADSFDINTICSLRKRQQLLSFPLNRLEINSPYTNSNLTYEQLNMKRKAQILKYNKRDTNNITSSESWSQINNQRINPMFTNRKVEVLYDKNTSSYVNFITPAFLDTTLCPSSKNLIVRNSNESDVPGPNILLYDDPDVPIYMYNNNTLPLGIENNNDDINMQILYNNDYTVPQNIFTDIFTHYVVSNSNNLIVESFNYLIPISFYFNTTVSNSFSSLNNEINIPNINITLLDVEFQIFFNDQLASSNITIDDSNLIKNINFDISFNISNNKTVTLTKFLGYINVNVLDIDVTPGFIYDMKIRFTFDSIQPTNFSFYRSVFPNESIGTYVFPSNSNLIIEENALFNMTSFPIYNEFNIVSSNSSNFIFRILNRYDQIKEYTNPTKFIQIDNIILSEYVKLEVDKNQNYVIRNTSMDNNNNRIVEPTLFVPGRKYFLKNGTYYFMGISDKYPFTILNDNNPNLIIETYNIDNYNSNRQYQFTTSDATYYTGNIKITVNGDFGNLSFHTLNNHYMGGEYAIEYFDPLLDSLTTNIQCLYQNTTNIINIENINDNNYYYFNDISYNYTSYIGVIKGNYRIENIPYEHPIGFVYDDKEIFEIKSGIPLLDASSNLLTRDISGVTVYFFYNYVEFSVKSFFDNISYICYNHGYMGGENKLVYNKDCPISIENLLIDSFPLFNYIDRFFEPEPKPEPEPEPELERLYANIAFKIDNIMLVDITEVNTNNIINNTKQLYANQLGISPDLIQIILSRGSIIMDVVIILEGFPENNISTVDNIKNNIEDNKINILSIFETETSNNSISVDNTYGRTIVIITDTAPIIFESEPEPEPDNSINLPLIVDYIKLLIDGEEYICNILSLQFSNTKTLLSNTISSNIIGNVYDVNNTNPNTIEYLEQLSSSNTNTDTTSQTNNYTTSQTNTDTTTQTNTDTTTQTNTDTTTQTNTDTTTQTNTDTTTQTNTDTTNNYNYLSMAFANAININETTDDILYSSYLTVNENEPTLIPNTTLNWNNLNNQIWFKTGYKVSPNEKIKIAQFTCKHNSYGNIDYFYADRSHFDYQNYKLSIINGQILPSGRTEIETTVSDVNNENINFTVDSINTIINNTNYIYNAIYIEFKNNTKILSNRISTNIIGNIYKHPNGNDYGPNSRENILTNENLIYDSYLSLGSTVPILLPKNINSWNNIDNQIWFYPNKIIDKNKRMKIAQFTLSEDSNGKIQYTYADDNNNNYLLINLLVENGFIIKQQQDIEPDNEPEPESQIDSDSDIDSDISIIEDEVIKYPYFANDDYIYIDPTTKQKYPPI